MCLLLLTPQKSTAISSDMISRKFVFTTEGRHVEIRTMADGRTVSIDHTLVGDFLQSPNAEMFSKMNKETKEAAVTQSMVIDVMDGGVKISGTDSFGHPTNVYHPYRQDSRFRSEQLPQYLAGLNNNERAGLYQQLWQYISSSIYSSWTDEGKKKLVDIFRDATKGKSDQASIQLCGALQHLYGAGVDSSLQETEKKTKLEIWEVFRDIIRERPELYNTQCHLMADQGDQVFNVRDMLKTYSPKIASELERSQTDRRLIKVDIKNTIEPLIKAANSACTEKEVRSYFHDAIESLMETKTASRYLMGVNKGYCRLNGMIEKNAKNEFVYKANYGGMNPLDKSYSLRFFNLSEAVTLVMATQLKVPSPSADALVMKTESKVGGAEAPATQNVGNAIYFPFGSK